MSVHTQKKPHNHKVLSLCYYVYKISFAVYLRTKMDLIEINYHDYLAECASTLSECLTCWFKYDWENNVLRFYKGLRYSEGKINIDDIQFRVGDNLICLSEGVFTEEPYTNISPHFEGRLTTLVMLATIFVKDGKLNGKMRIYNASKPPVDTNYELILKNAELKQLLGLRVWGDGWNFDNCKYKFTKSDLHFTYTDKSKERSVFERETDIDKRKLLEQYMLEYITKELGTAIEEYQLSQLSIKASASDCVGADYSLKNMLSIHNKKMRKAFNNLSEKIISIANSLLIKKSPKLQFAELFALVEQKNKEYNVKVYSGYIDKFDSLHLAQGKNTIISNESDLVIVHVPVDFQDLKLHIAENANDSSVEHKEQSYETSGSHFVMSLKRLSTNEVEMNLVDFKIINITPISETPYIVAMDHLIRFEIEQRVKPFLKEAMKHRELQELAIDQDVDIEYDADDDLMAEDSGSE